MGFFLESGEYISRTEAKKLITEYRAAKAEQENLWDNFRQLLDGYTFLVREHNTIDIHTIKQMAGYYTKHTGNKYVPPFQFTQQETSHE